MESFALYESIFLVFFLQNKKQTIRLVIDVLFACEVQNSGA